MLEVLEYREGRADQVSNPAIREPGPAEQDRLSAQTHGRVGVSSKLSLTVEANNILMPMCGIRFSIPTGAGRLEQFEC
jgi:hypothetical protein